MALKSKLTDDLIKIAAAGGGLDIDVSSRLTDDLIKIAYAASRGGGTVIFRGLGSRLTDDLIKIAYSGKGRVIFKDS